MNSDEMFKHVLEQFPDGVIVLNVDNNIIFVNNMAEKIRHISKSEKYGKNVLDCHPEQTQEKVKRSLNYLKEKEISFKRMIIDKESNKVFENVYQAILDANQEFIGSIVLSKDITDKYQLEQEKLENTQILQEQVAELSEKLNNLFLSSLASIVNALEAKDVYTNGHSKRVTDICKTFVENVFGQTQLLHDLLLAGKLHDIGKIGIRESVLTKPDKLTDEEYEHMKTHPLITEQILLPIISLKDVINIAKHHHERFDGAGYPDGLKGEEIHIGSRILALADSYDAMTSSRPYRKTLTPGIAILEIKKNLGTQFDPELGEKFIELIESGTI